MLDFLVGNDGLSAVVAFGLVLIPAIFIHEMGHFLAAKAVGITILEFGIGFPPRMMTLFTRGETEYTLNWLPIGGFVRPLGEDFVRPVSEDEVQRERMKLENRALYADDQPEILFGERASLRSRGVEHTTSVNEAKPLARIAFMSAGPIANMLTALVVFVIIGLSGLPTVVGGSAGVVDIDPTSALAAAGLQQGDLIETLNGEYFNSAQVFALRLHELRGEEVTLVVQRGAQGEVFDLTFLPGVSADASGEVENLVFVSAVAPNSPALAADLRVDDLIVAFNGEPFGSFEDLPQRTRESLGEAVTLTLLRNDERFDVQVVPRVDPPEGQGAIGIGIVPAYNSLTAGAIFVEGGRQQALVSLTLAESIQFSLGRIVFFLETMIKLPGELIQGTLSPDETRLMSPLAISQFGGVFLQQSIEQNQPVVILNFIAIISIALGITNLLPLPALDGGRIVFVVLELVRGRPIAPEREGLVHLIGMAFLLSLMAIAFLNDIFNPITGLLP